MVKREHLLTPTSAILLPAGQSAGTALAVFITVGSIWWYFDLDRALPMAALAAGVAFGGAWLISLSWWRSQFDTLAPAPVQTYPLTVRAEVISTDPSGAYMAGVFADFDVDLEHLVRAARRINAGVGFSLAGLAGPHKPLSRSEFESFRDACISRGLAYWKNPGAHAQGCDLTAGGRALMRRLSEVHTHENTLTQPESLSPRFNKLLPGAHAHAGARAVLGGR